MSKYTFDFPDIANLISDVNILLEALLMIRFDPSTESKSADLNNLIAKEVVKIAEDSGVYGVVQVTTLPMGETENVFDSFTRPDGNRCANSVIALIGESFCLKIGDTFENLLGLNGLKTATIIRTCSDKHTGLEIRGESNYPGKRLLTGPRFYVVIGLTTNESFKNEAIISTALKAIGVA